MDNDTKAAGPKSDPTPGDPMLGGSRPAEPGKPAPYGLAADTGRDAKPFEPAKSSSAPGGALGSLASGTSSSDPQEGAKGHVGLPVAEPFQGFSAPLPKERAGVFSQLVTDDGDIAGLVAYSIYKQNKLDWLSAFEAAKGRSPSEDELASYIIGEGTPRRIATYRHLAEATLAGNGPRAGGATTGPRGGMRRVGPALSDKTAMIATYAIIALVSLIGLLVAAHYTMSSR